MQENAISSQRTPSLSGNRFHSSRTTGTIEPITSNTVTNLTTLLTTCLLLCWGYLLSLQTLTVVATEMKKNAAGKCLPLYTASGHTCRVKIIRIAVTKVIQTPSVILVSLLTLFLQFFETIPLETFCDTNCHVDLSWGIITTTVNLITVVHVTNGRIV